MPHEPAPATIDADHLRHLIAEDLPRLAEIRHDLHAHPELGYEERRTSGIVQQELEAAGVEHATGLAGGTGVLGHIPGPGERAVALRADMDALPIHEEPGLPWASTVEGCMHACGHDGHTSILLGTARVLATLSQDGLLPSPVTLVFQPAEEGGAGGRRMVEDGCLDGSILGPAVSRMFGLHGWPWIPLGTVCTRPGPILAAADMFTVRILGTGGHAATPQLARDPILAAASVVSGLQSICSRNTDPHDAVVISITQFHGGDTHNVIPDAVEIGGTVRTLTETTRDMVVDRLRDMSEHIALAHGCRAELSYTIGYPVTSNDPGLVSSFLDLAGETIGKDRVSILPDPCMGGEDFSYYGQAVPSCFFFLGMLPDSEDSMPGLHQSSFDFNDDAMATGIELFCRLAMAGAGP